MRRWELALERELPLLLVPATGGVASEMGEALGQDWSRDIPEDLLHKLVDPDLGAEPLARAVVAALGYMVRSKPRMANARPVAAKARKTRILFLASSPSDQARLKIMEERSKIDRALHGSRFSNRFKMIDGLATHASDLQRLLLEHQPNILHFSGHGSSRGEIILQNASGLSQPVSAQTLGELFGRQPELQGVLLNACFSAEQAEGIAQSVPWVIGMEAAIPDEHSIAFAVSFYLALGAGNDVEDAFESGRSQLRLEFGSEDPPARIIRRGGTVHGRDDGVLRKPIVTCVEVPCQGRPEHFLVKGSLVHLGTDRGEWFVLGRRSPVRSMPPLALCSCAAVDAQGALAVGSFEGMVARGRSEHWDMLSCDSAVLSIEAVHGGLVVGESSGRVRRLLDSGEAVTEWMSPEPVTQVLPVSETLAVLGSDGQVRLAGEAHSSGKLPQVDLGEACRAFALFPTEQEGCFGVVSGGRVALVDSDSARVVALSEEIGGGIREVVPLMGHPASYAALTDEGSLWLLDERLEPQPLRLPKKAGEAVGVAAISHGGLLAWTRTGQLFRVDRHRAISEMAPGEVVFAAQAPGASGTFITVKVSDGNTRVEWGAGAGG